MEKLLPCPFCGSTDVLVITDEDDDGEFAAVGCNDCGAGSRQHYFCGEDAREYAAGAWNRRPPEDTCLSIASERSEESSPTGSERSERREARLQLDRGRAALPSAEDVARPVREAIENVLNCAASDCGTANEFALKAAAEILSLFEKGRAR